MINQTYVLNMSDGFKLEFAVFKSNTLSPNKETRELGITVLGERQLDADLDEDDLDSLIKYLSECRDYIKTFNENSTPIL